MRDLQLLDFGTALFKGWVAGFVGKEVGVEIAPDRGHRFQRI